MTRRSIERETSGEKKLSFPVSAVNNAAGFYGLIFVLVYKERASGMESTSLPFYGSPTDSKILVASCNLNQWALDFDGNLERVKDSIRQAKELGARYRLGPELELSGYSCEDHFRESDTSLHCEQSLAAILESDLTMDILCDIGMPVVHGGVSYNCRVFVLNKKILLVRPKAFLANDGNYHEPRFFRSWKGKPNVVEDHYLSEILSKVTGQSKVSMGMAVIRTKETKIAAEVCEELWTPRSPHITYALHGVEIFGNGSGSHHQLRKLDSRIALMNSATTKCGGCYLYANQQGCDGTRLYFDGSSMINVNGKIMAQASQFSLRDVEVVTACVDLEDIRSYRASVSSMQEQATLLMSHDEEPISVVDASWFSLCPPSPGDRTVDDISSPSEPIELKLHSPEEECALGPACWMWDYLRRSGACGFMLPLSGGADSASVASIVRVMCDLAVVAAVEEFDTTVMEDILRMAPDMEEPINEYMSQRVGRAMKKSTTGNPALTSWSQNVVKKGKSEALRKLGDRFCGYVLHTVYMGTENSSSTTFHRAKNLGASLGSYHSAIVIDTVVQAVLGVFSGVAIAAGKSEEEAVPRFKVRGGTHGEDLALQNIQARLRMVMTYLCAQLFPWCRGRSGFLLVLGSGNVDEALRGYMTKYDCSSADINPIGGICKKDLRKLLLWASDTLECPVLREIVEAPPSAELQPIDSDNSSNYTQTDEEDMGMSYDELGVFGFLRKVHNSGPVTMFLKLLDNKEWRAKLNMTDIAAKVKRFFFYYGVNRHKLTTLTPSYHAENYSPDDNRFDFRPFLYNSKWARQFRTIDAIVEQRSKPATVMK